jgi:uracil-DNA glycosylase
MNDGLRDGSGRRTAFLSEIGVGPEWRLRRRASSAAAAEPDCEPESEPQSAPPTAMSVPDVLVPAAAPAAGNTDSAWAESGSPPAATDEEIARMGWPQLKAAVAGCTRCSLCRTGRAAIFGSGDQAAQWMVVTGAPNRADESERRLFAGDAGQLLSNMLLAIGLAPGHNVYVSSLVKCRATDDKGAERAPTPTEVAACRPYLEREIGLTNAAVILAAGPTAANGLLGKASGEPLAAARGTLHRLGSAALVATHHPEHLLRQGADKAGAWADLCLAHAAHAAAGR